jgi:hypothetical protein
VSAQEPTEANLIAFVANRLAGASDERVAGSLRTYRADWVRLYRLAGLGLLDPDDLVVGEGDRPPSAGIDKSR